MAPLQSSSNTPTTKAYTGGFIQSVWLVRYGLTEHPLVEDLGPYDSDIDPKEGIDHALAIAKRIASGVKGNVYENGSIPGVVYASPFLRTAHTGYIVANELERTRKQQRRSQRRSEQSPPAVELRFEEGLWEWLIPSLLVTKSDGIKTHPRPVEALRRDLVTLEEGRVTESRQLPAVINASHPSVNPYDDEGDVAAGITCVPARKPPPSTSTPAATAGRAPRWTEPEDRLLERCATTLSGLLEAHKTDGTSLCIVSHAPCDQAMAHHLERQASLGTIEKPSQSALKPWPLGGITVFSRRVNKSSDDEITGYGNWTMELYGNTDHMPGAYKAGLKEWSLPCFSESASRRRKRLEEGGLLEPERKVPEKKTRA